MADDRGIPPTPGRDGGWSNVPSHGQPGVPSQGAPAYPPQPQGGYPPQVPAPPAYGNPSQPMQGYGQPAARAGSSKLPWILGIGAVVLVGGFVVLVGVVWTISAASGSSSGSSSMFSFGDSNPLIGKWRLVEGSPGGCPAEVTFTSSTVTQSFPGQPGSPLQVTYNVGPEKVWVMTDTGVSGAVGYKIASHNKIVLDSWAACAWERSD